MLTGVLRLGTLLGFLGQARASESQRGIPAVRFSAVERTLNELLAKEFFSLVNWAISARFAKRLCSI